jgi:hypothetical protein
LFPQRDQHHSAQFRKAFADSSNEQLISSVRWSFYDPSYELPVPGRFFITAVHLAFKASSSNVRFIISLNNVDAMEKESYKGIRACVLWNVQSKHVDCFRSYWMMELFAHLVHSIHATRPTRCFTGSGKPTSCSLWMTIPRARIQK